jgi:hypothetical protein
MADDQDREQQPEVRAEHVDDRERTPKQRVA